MRRLRTMAWLIVCLLLSVSAATAQGAPDQIGAAVQALGERVGQSLSLGDMEQWRWEQRVFESTALGCPQADETYDEQTIAGYVFTLTYGGTEYAYHVSADTSLVRLCATSGDAESTAEATDDSDDVDYSNRLCPAPPEDVDAYPRSRLAPDVQATGTLPVNRLRENPSTEAAILADMPQNAVFIVTGGPQCDDEGIVWWQVDYDGVVGWTAEADGDDRYIVPQAPRPLPEREIITAANVTALTFLSRVQGNVLPTMHFSPNSSLLAVAGAPGSDSLHLYQLAALETLPRYIDQDEPLLSMDFHPNGTQVLVGTREGGVHLWNLAPDAALTEALFLQTHNADVQAVALAPDGNRFISAGNTAQVTDPAYTRENALVEWNIADVLQTTVLDDAATLVIDVAYAPDGQSVAAVDADGNLYLWSLTTPERPQVIEDTGATSVAISPNGQFMAVGQADGVIALRNPTTGEAITTLSGHLGLVSDLAFSPDSTWLVSGSGDGTLRLWSTQDDSNLAIIDVDSGEVLGVAVAPDGRTIAAATDDTQIDFYGVPQVTATATP